MAMHNVKVSSIGFDKRSIERLNIVLRKKLHNILVVDAVPDAHLFLLNLDANNITDLYKDFVVKNQNVPAIGLSTSKADGWKMRKIKMPVNTDELIDSIMQELPDVDFEAPKSGGISEDKIKKAMEAIETKKVASKLTSKIDQDKSKTTSQREIARKTDEMCFDTERFLLGHALEAINTLKQKHDAALITCWGDKSILFQPAKGEVLTNLSDNQIRNLAIAPLDDKLSAGAEIIYLDSAGIEKVIKLISGASRTMSIEAFMWDLGLLTCKGRIPQEVSLADNQYLRRWPNITRIRLTENTLRIVAYWVRQPCSLSEISEKLDIPLQDVFSVFTAAYSAGLADQAKRQSDNLLDAADVEQNDKRGLLNSLMSRLKKMNREVA
jgi:hypothetical protein